MASVAALVRFVDGVQQNNDTKVTADYSVRRFCAAPGALPSTIDGME